MHVLEFNKVTVALLRGEIPAEPAESRDTLHYASLLKAHGKILSSPSEFIRKSQSECLSRNSTSLWKQRHLKTAWDTYPSKELPWAQKCFAPGKLVEVTNLYLMPVSPRLDEMVSRTLLYFDFLHEKGVFLEVRLSAEYKCWLLGPQAIWG